MKKSEATAVGFKVVSLYAFLQAISALSVPITLYASTSVFRIANANALRTVQRNSPEPETLSIVTFIPCALLLIFGALLWLSAKRIEARSKVHESSTEPDAGIPPEMLQRIIFSALGVLIVVQAVPPLVNALSALSLPTRAINLSFYRLAEGLIQLVFGSWLIIGSKQLRRFQNWILDSISD